VKCTKCDGEIEDCGCHYDDAEEDDYDECDYCDGQLGFCDCEVYYCECEEGQACDCVEWNESRDGIWVW
jgi:hypothetical protein